MNWFSVLNVCFKLNSLPKTIGPFFSYYITVGPFKFHYWAAGASKEEVKIEIVHPDGDSLIILHKVCSGIGPRPDWECDKTGFQPWTTALNKAYDTIKSANCKATAELEHARAVYQQTEREKELARLQKFEGMFK